MNTDSQPETNSYFRILSSAFGCFGTGLYLFIFFISKPPDNVVFLWFSLLTLLIASFLLLAVLLNRKCQIIYKFAQWLVGKFVDLWVFTFGLVIALNRIMQVLSGILNNSLVEPYNIMAKIILILSIIFFIAYIVVIIVLPYSSIKAKADYKRLQFYLSASLCYTSFTCLLVILSSVWPRYYSEPYAYIILLIPAAIFLYFSAKNAPAERLILTTALIITLVSIVLIGIGYALSGYPSWLWVCFSFVIIAVIILLYGIFRIDRANKKLGIPFG